MLQAGGALAATEVDKAGGWANQTERQKTYEACPSLQFLLVIGGFGDGTAWKTAHRLPRADVVPPVELTDAVFPRQARAWLDARADGTAAMLDGTSLEGNSKQFCETLAWLAVVLVQDAPFLRNSQSVEGKNADSLSRERTTQRASFLYLGRAKKSPASLLLSRVLRRRLCPRPISNVARKSGVSLCRERTTQRARLIYL
jgi:hypothetical protein